MSKKQKRNNAYYEDRLERDHPDIFADLKAGKFASAADAFVAAGLKKPRTRLQEMKNAWMKASAKEQSDFQKWLASRLHVPTPRPVPSGSTPAAAGLFPLSATAPISDPDRKLSAQTKQRVSEIMLARNLKMGDLMAELGLSKLNASIGNAIKQDSQIKPHVMKALEKWLKDNACV